jgi:hypothetical protein
MDWGLLRTRKKTAMAADIKTAKTKTGTSIHIIYEKNAV